MTTFALVETAIDSVIAMATFLAARRIAAKWYRSLVIAVGVSYVISALASAGGAW